MQQRHILVFGATGQTGRLIVQKGLEKGYKITAFVRNPGLLNINHKNFSLFKGDLSDKESVLSAVKDKNAVVSALGNKTLSAIRSPNSVISQGVQHILAAMFKTQVKRLLFISSFGVSDNIFLPEKIFIRLVLKNIFKDIPLQEKYIQQSHIDWTIIRPARLINSFKKRVYRADEDVHIGLFSSISRADVADFVVNNIDSTRYIRQIVTLSY